MARFVLILSALAVSITGGYGLFTGNYAVVGAVWAIAGPLVGAVVGHYFGPRKDSG